jgi:hypothetical protein
LVLYNKQGEITKVYPVGSDPHQRYWLVMDILDAAVRKHADRTLKEREEKNQKIDSQIEECDKEVFTSGGLTFQEFDSSAKETMIALQELEKKLTFS